MPSIQMKYFAVLKEIVGKKEETIHLSETGTVNDVLHLLSTVYGEGFSNYVLRKDGILRDNLTILINGEALVPGSAGTRKLNDGDVMVILPPVGGG